MPESSKEIPWLDTSLATLQAITSQCRAYLAAVIIWLAGQRGKEAYLCYQVSWATTCGNSTSFIAGTHSLIQILICRCYAQDALTVQNFTTSEEAFAAEDLLNAFRSGDADQITGLIKPTSMYMQLDSQVCLLRVLLVHVTTSAVKIRCPWTMLTLKHCAGVKIGQEAPTWGPEDHRSRARGGCSRAEPLNIAARLGRRGFELNMDCRYTVVKHSMYYAYGCGARDTQL